MRGIGRELALAPVTRLDALEGPVHCLHERHDLGRNVFLRQAPVERCRPDVSRQEGEPPDGRQRLTDGPDRDRDDAEGEHQQEDPGLLKELLDQGVGKHIGMNRALRDLKIKRRLRAREPHGDAVIGTAPRKVDMAEIGILARRWNWRERRADIVRADEHAALRIEDEIDVLAVRTAVALIERIGQVDTETAVRSDVHMSGKIGGLRRKRPVAQRVPLEQILDLQDREQQQKARRDNREHAPREARGERGRDEVAEALHAAELNR